MSQVAELVERQESQVDVRRLFPIVDIAITTGMGWMRNTLTVRAADLMVDPIIWERVKRVLRRLSRDGSLLQRPQVEQFFQALHSIGLGEFISGEGVRRPRFVWGYPLTQLSHVATGEAWELQPLPDPAPTNGHENGDVEELLDSEDVLDSGEPIRADLIERQLIETQPTRKGATIKHTFRLREDLSVKFRLPRDLTITEAVRLAEYIKTLPF